MAPARASQAPSSQAPSTEAQGGWDPFASHIRVVLRDIVTEARVGLHAWEQHPERPSRLVVNVEMFAPRDKLPADGGDAPFIDYDVVRAEVKRWPERPHTKLLETLAEQLVGVCMANPRVQACKVSVMKPDIFNEAAEAGVELFRVREK